MYSIPTRTEYLLLLFVFIIVGRIRVHIANAFFGGMKTVILVNAVHRFSNRNNNIQSAD